MEFLFRPRSSGKRQVKPSQDIAFLEDQIAADESSDDSEYKIGDNSDKCSDNSGGSDDESSSSASDNDEEEGSDQEAKDELSKLKAELSTEELLKLAQNVSANNQDSNFKVIVCGCCLGETSNDANEIVECDGCGVAVHEGCYGVSESLSVASELSEALTEPWFCEPCKAGLNKTPSCELCPYVGGLYKQTEVGRWVHLICALYVPGVAFADTENLTNVTVFEMNYSSWGKRNCMLCEETRMARTGVCIQCDAGMCKSYFHVTCAQKFGLLCEPSYQESDPYLAHCKIHTDKTVIKRRKRSFMTSFIQTQKRWAVILARNEQTEMPGLKREQTETEDQRILRKLCRQQNSYSRDRVKRSEPWVPTQKIPKALITSASAIRKIQRMGEIKGLSLKRQLLEEQQALSVMEARKKWNVAPSFSVEFVAYYHDRQSRIEELRKNLSDQLKQQASLREKETQARPKFDLATRLQETAEEKNVNIRKRIQVICDTLNKVKTLPDLPALKPLQKPIEIVTPNIKAKATIWSNTNGGVKYQASSATPDLSLKTCTKCKRTKDQHLLVHCDSCKLYYHLGCLTPPLTRMPKKTKIYEWHCSECQKNSSSDEDVVILDDSAPRKRRLAAAKAIAASRHNSDLDEDILFEISPPKIPPNPSKASNGGPVATDEESQRNKLIASADLKLKEDLKRKKRMEREKRRAERKKRKREEKKKRKLERLEQEDDEDEEDGDDDGAEIIEHENGQVEVRIKPKKIKLKINNSSVLSASTNP